MKKLFNRYNAKSWIVCVVAFLTAGVVFFRLPDQIPIHFDINGNPDNYGTRWMIFLFPAIILLIQLLAEITRKYDPKSEAYEAFESHYYNIHFAVSLLMYGIQLLTIGYVFGVQIAVDLVAFTFVALLFIFIGNIMPKFKHNYFVGIKTSWTLADERVWFKTHRFAGKVWVLGGIVMLGSIFLADAVRWTVFIVAVILLIVLPAGASFYYFNQLNDPSSTS